MSMRLSTTAEIVAKLSRCSSVGPSAGNTQSDVRSSGKAINDGGDTLTTHQPEKLEYIYSERKANMRVKTLSYEINGALWDNDFERRLCQVLCEFAEINEVRTLNGIVNAVSHAATVLNKIPGKRLINNTHVREKIIRMRCLFYKFWTMVVNFQLPVDIVTGKTCMTDSYKAVDRNENDLEKHFFQHGLPAFDLKHRFFICLDAAFFPEEQLYYFAEGDKMLSLMDRVVWNDNRDILCFKVLARLASEIDVTKEAGLLMAIHEASKQVGMSEDKVRRLVRRTRFPFFRLFVHLKRTGRQPLLHTGEFEMVEEDKLLCPEDLATFAAHSAQGFEGFHLQKMFFHRYRATELPEEIIFYCYVENGPPYDVGGLLRRIPPHNTDEDIKDLEIPHSKVVAYARSLNLC